MSELQVALLVIGSFFIIAVLVHGIWKMRKESAQQKALRAETDNRIEPTAEEYQIDHEQADECDAAFTVGDGLIDEPVDDDLESDKQDYSNQAYDEFGIGAVRVVSTDEDHAESAVKIAIEEPQEVIEPPKYASVVTQPKPHMTVVTKSRVEEGSDDDFPEPPEFLLKSAETPVVKPISEPKPVAESAPKPQEKLQQTPDLQPDPIPDLMPEQSVEAPAAEKPTARRTVKKRSTTRKRKEPTLGDDQMRIDFDEPTPQVKSPAPQPSSEPVEQEVLIINVRADESRPLSGAALLPLLLTLGFKFGDQDIFHRHVNANGKGPVLFSLANMVKPGVFDIDNLETFTTLGVSLFMVLPIEGDQHQVFNMMHNAARKIADEFGAQLLDGRRSVLTKQGVQRYSEKIREFERQRIIAKSSH